MIEVKRYNKNFRSEWNDFLRSCKNATFMLRREFIEYHKVRFSDNSLMIYDNDKLVALFPASIDDNILTSHGGLTYGGLIVKKSIKLNDYIKVFKEMLVYLEKIGVKILNYKALPIFYTHGPSQEEDYVMFLIRAQTYRVDTSVTVKYSERLPFQTRRKRMIKKARNKSFDVRDNNDFRDFWDNILSPNLQTRFGKSPVHSLNEIEMLHKSFPDNIRQINIYDEQDNIVAGCTVFVTENVCHAQYISANDQGRKSGALDLLFDYLINELYANKEFFDFGICNEEEGRFINHGLLDWKEGFGGRTYVHKFYSVDVSNHHYLNSVIKII